MADQLQFTPLGGKWHNGNDFPSVEVVKITGPAGVSALLYTCHVNVDYDGAANAYGPRDKPTLDSLEDAGYPNWWYGLISLHPQGRIQDYNDNSPSSFTIGTKGRLIKEIYNLELDERYPDKYGRLPVKQKSGPFKGYFISATPHHHGSMYQQSSYIDAANVAYGALSGNLAASGVRINDCALAIRHDRPLQSPLYFADMGGTKGKQAEALAECSYKVHLNLGGEPKKPHHTPRNNYTVSFLVFPGSGGGSQSPEIVANAVRPQLMRLSLASNSYELPLLIALAGAAGGGKSGLDQLTAYRNNGNVQQIANYMNVEAGLARYGFTGSLVSLTANLVARAAEALR